MSIHKRHREITSNEIQPMPGKKKLSPFPVYIGPVEYLTTPSLKPNNKIRDASAVFLISFCWGNGILFEEVTDSITHYIFLITYNKPAK